MIDLRSIDISYMCFSHTGDLVNIFPAQQGKSGDSERWNVKSEY